MEIRNADWIAMKDDTGQISLYRHGDTQPVFVLSMQEFLSLKAIIEQIARGG